MGPFQPRHLSRLIIVIALLGAAAALIVASGRASRLPAGDWYELSRQRIVQADLQYRLSLFWEDVAEARALPAIGEASELRERAVAAYERVALAGRPNPLALHRLGVIYGERGYAAQAQQVLTQAAAVDETRAALYFALANLYGPDRSKALPANIPARLEQQEQWLADLSLLAYYKATHDSAMEEKMRLQQLRHSRVFGLQALALLTGYGLLGLVGLIIALLLVIRRGFFVQRPRAPRPPVVVPWESLDAIETVALLYFALAVGGVLAGLAMRQIPQSPAMDVTRAVVAALQYLLFTGAVIAFILSRVRAPRNRRLKALGVRTPRLPKLIAEGIGGYGVLLVILAVSGFGRTAMTGVLQAGESFVMNVHTLPAKVLLFVLICVVAPVVEELIFRGFVYPGLRRRMTVGAAVLSSALLFALMHNNPGALVPITLIGIVLAVLYERNRSIIPAIVCHALNNTFVFFLMTLAQ
ncbi:MAG: CPBP family glutamic-type intramembrane protease [Armatimonadota bacterium]